MEPIQKTYLFLIRVRNKTIWIHSQILSLANWPNYYLPTRYRSGTRLDGPPKSSLPIYPSPNKMKPNLWISWKHSWVTFIMEPGPSSLFILTYHNILGLTNTFFFLAHFLRFHNAAIIFFAVAASHYITLFGGGWSPLMWGFKWLITQAGKKLQLTYQRELAIFDGYQVLFLPSVPRTTRLVYAD